MTKWTTTKKTAGDTLANAANLKAKQDYDKQLKEYNTLKTTYDADQKLLLSLNDKDDQGTITAAETN